LTNKVKIITQQLKTKTTLDQIKYCTKVMSSKYIKDQAIITTKFLIILRLNNSSNLKLTLGQILKMLKP